MQLNKLALYRHQFSALQYSCVLPLPITCIVSSIFPTRANSQGYEPDKKISVSAEAHFATHLHANVHSRTVDVENLLYSLKLVENNNQVVRRKMQLSHFVAVAVLGIG
jgi:hypothetical protein